MSEVIAISPGNPAFSLCFLQPSISYDVCSVHFSRSVVSERPHGLQHVRFPCPSTPGACSNSCPSSQWCHPAISSSAIPFSSCLQSFPATVLCIRWPKYWSLSFSISPSNEYAELISFRIDWFDLFALQRTLKSLLQHHSSKASILWCSASLWSGAGLRSQELIDTNTG